MKFYALLLALLATLGLSAQVSINNNSTDPDGSAMLDVQSTEKGMLIPRMNSAQRDAISTPATGLIIYNLDDSGFQSYDGSTWTDVSGPWERSGDTLIYTTVNVGIGTNSATLNGSDYRLYSQRQSTDAAAIMGYNGTARGMLGVWDANFADVDLPLVQSAGVLGYAPSFSNNTRAAVYGYSESTSGAAYGGIFQSVGVNSGQNIALYAKAANSTINNYVGYFVGEKSYFEGNVGIGTLSPTSKLDVNGKVSADTMIASGNIGIGLGIPQTRLEIEDIVPEIRLTDGRINSGGVAGEELGKLSWYTRDATNPGEYAPVAAIDIVAENSTVAPDGRFLFRTGTNGDGLSTRMVITNEGHVGIGTTTPSTPLSILGNGATSPVGITQNQVGSTTTLELTTTDLDGDQATRLLFRGGTDNANVEFYTGARGSETSTMFIGTTGNVGIGTITPTSRFDVAGGNISLNGGWISNDGDNEGIRIGDNGRVGIGSLPGNATKFLVSADDNWGYAGLFESTGTAFALGVFGPATSNKIFFVDSPGTDNHLVVLGNGRVGIGRSPTSNALEVDGNASKSSAGSWLANSDRRIKTDIQTIDHAVDMLERVRLVSFRYTEEYRANHEGVGNGRYLNVIAQEFAEVFPDHVKGSGEYLPDGSEILQVDTYPLTIYSAAAIQEQQKIIEEQQQRIQKLEEENSLIKTQVEELVQLKALVQQLQQSFVKDQLEANNIK